MIFILLTTTVIAAFDLKCPEELDRKFRAKHVCYNITEVDRYSCLLDLESNTYIESCADRADYVRPGQKYVKSGKRKNTDCSPVKYQPFLFWSHKLSQCVFKKSLCKELGQIQYLNGSSIVDSTCRCDYTAGYAFVTEPRNKCFCSPTIEDCMCYLVACQNNIQLNQDYNCSLREDLSSPFNCQPIIRTAAKTNASSTITAKENTLKRSSGPKVVVTCLVIIAIIVFTIMAVIVFRHFPLRITRKEEYEHESQKKISPEEAVETLRIIFELLEQLLNNEEFDKNFQEELSAACPNYMDVLQTYKRDLLRNECCIIIAGETSAGKTTLINQLVGKDVFYTSHLAATGTVCRIRNSKSLLIKVYSKDEHLIKEETAVNLAKLKSLLKKYTDVKQNPPEMIDVHLPVPILKGNIIIVDTPGIGENEKLDNILLKYLQHAVSFVFIVNAGNAGGVQNDRLLRILKTVIENRKEMPCFEPDEVIFLTNKWDIIKNVKEDGEEEDQHTKTWNEMYSKLEEGWPGFHTDRLFKISLEQVMGRRKTPFTKELKKFQSMLDETIERNKNKRVEYYFSFLQVFAAKAEIGIVSRINFLSKSDDDRKNTILKNKRTVRQLKEVTIKKMEEAKKYKTEVIEKLANRLLRYLKSDKGKREILNPQGKKEINSVPISSLTGEVFTRINLGINRWCEGKDVKIVVEEIETKMKNILSDVQLMIHDIEKDITGFARSIHDVSFAVFTRSALRVTLLSNGINLFQILRSYLDFRQISRQQVKEDRAIKIYEKWLSSFTYDNVLTSFEENFGAEYDRVITHIFEKEIPQMVDGFLSTIDKLDEELCDIKKKNKSFAQLNIIVQDIHIQIEHFKEVAQIKCV